MNKRSYNLSWNIGPKEQAKLTMNKTSLISVEDVLHVFGAWTLMTRASESCQLKIGAKINLLDASRSVIGKVNVKKILSSRNSEIVPIVVDLTGNDIDVKSIKFCQVVASLAGKRS